MKEDDYFLAIWRDCQDSSTGVYDCINCIVPLKKCNDYLTESAIADMEN